MPTTADVINQERTDGAVKWIFHLPLLINFIFSCRVPFRSTTAAPILAAPVPPLTPPSLLYFVLFSYPSSPTPHFCFSAISRSLPSTPSSKNIQSPINTITTTINFLNKRLCFYFHLVNHSPSFTITLILFGQMKHVPTIIFVDVPRWSDDQ